MSGLLSLDPIIRTSCGKIRGQLRKTIYGDEYFCFDGIPYAKPPLNELRFKAPQELEPWQGIRDCTEPAPKCLQYNRYSKQIEGSEDCLYLNIYVKSLGTSNPLPVMVYLHGGMHKTGDASRKAWGPDYFMMKEVVLISIGYRLGPLGYLSLSDPKLNVPGNAGLKDQVLALKWIMANVASFNGDPDNITLFGHSSGSCSVHYLLVSPTAAGLFHKAILMSGFCFVNNFIPNIAYRLAKSIGYDGDDQNDKGILDSLLNVDVKELLNRDLISEEENNRGISVQFLPCIEPYSSNDSILIDDPENLLQSNWSNTIPVMIGNTSNEELLLYNKFRDNKKLFESFRCHPEYLLPIQIQFHCNEELQQKLAKKVISLHYGGEESFTENVDNILELNSYRKFYHPSHRFMLARRSKPTFASTYLYRFDFDSPNFNFYRIKHCGPNIRGVGHVDDLSYIYWMPASFKLEKNSAEFKTIQRMISIWTSFASTSNPNCSVLGSTVWEPLDRNNTKNSHYCLNISNDLTFIKWPEAAKCAAWDEIYKEANIKLF